MLIWGLFHFKNNIHLFKEAIGQRICALLDGFNIVIHGVYQNFDENWIKTIKLGIFFGIFDVNLRSFHIKKSNYLFIEASWTTNLCTVERFQPSNPWSFWKVWQKLQKTIEFGNFFWFFDIFDGNLRSFSYWKQHSSLQRSHWTTHFCLVGWFQHFNPRSLSKIWWKSHKND